MEDTAVCLLVKKPARFKIIKHTLQMQKNMKQSNIKEKPKYEMENARQPNKNLMFHEFMIIKKEK